MTVTKEEPRRLSVIWPRMFQNVDDNYLEIFLITSQAAGLEPSEGRPMGVGKSTLAINMAYRAWAYAKGYIFIDWKKQVLVDEAPEDERVKLMKEIIDKYLFWRVKDMLKALKNAKERLPAVVWDDAQRDCPAWQHVPPEKRRLIEELTIVRPLVANIVITAPSMSDIAKPLRRLVNWEVIVPQRGLYEVHFLAKRRDFYEPVNDLTRMWYDASGTFEPLPPEVAEHYAKKREEAARLWIEEGEGEEGEKEGTAEAEERPATVRPRREKRGIKVKCWNCGYEWIYTGRRLSAACPSCRREVRIASHNTRDDECMFNY